MRHQGFHRTGSGSWSVCSVEEKLKFIEGLQGSLVAHRASAARGLQNFGYFFSSFSLNLIMRNGCRKQPSASNLKGHRASFVVLFVTSIVPLFKGAASVLWKGYVCFITTVAIDVDVS